VSVCDVPARCLRLGYVGLSIVLDYYVCGVVGWAILTKQYGLAKNCPEPKYAFFQSEMDFMCSTQNNNSGNVQFNKLQISPFQIVACIPFPFNAITISLLHVRRQSSHNSQTNKKAYQSFSYRISRVVCVIVFIIRLKGLTI